MTNKKLGELTREDLAQHYFQISNEMWGNLKPEIKEIFVAETDLEYSESIENKDALMDKVEWIQEDISNLYRTVYDLEEDMYSKFEAINQRISDMIALIGGRTVVKAADQLALSLSVGEDSEGTISIGLDEVQWTKLEDSNIYKITGTLIAEGTWTGIDGHTVFYPAGVIEAAHTEIVGKAIKRGHRDSAQDVIGFVTASAFLEGKAIFEGIIFHEATISDIGSGELTGTSMEALVKTIWNEAEQKHYAQSMKLLMATVVKKPACKICNDLSLASTVTLNDNGDKDMSTLNSSSQNPALTVANLSDGCFYGKLEEELMKTELAKDSVNQFMKIIRGIVRVSEGISRMRFEPAEGMTAPEPGDDFSLLMSHTNTVGDTTDATPITYQKYDYTGEIATDGTSWVGNGDWIIDDTYVWPGTTALPQIQTDLKDDKAGKSPIKDSDNGDTKMSTELEQIKSELEQVKLSLSSELETKSSLETKLKVADDKIVALEADIVTKDATITEQGKDLTARNTALEAIADAEIAGLITSIKAQMEDFDEKELLDGVESKAMQKKLLSGVFNTASKLKTITKLAVDDVNDNETKVKKILAEMGISDVTAFIERK